MTTIPAGYSVTSYAIGDRKARDDGQHADAFAAALSKSDGANVKGASAAYDPVVSGLPVEPIPDVSGLPFEPAPQVSGLPFEPVPDVSGLPVEPIPDVSGLPFEPDPKEKPGDAGDGSKIDPDILLTHRLSVELATRFFDLVQAAPDEASTTSEG